MFTSIDKAVAALIGGALTLAAMWGLDVAAFEMYIGPVGTVLTAILTYIIPNKT